MRIDRIIILVFCAMAAGILALVLTWTWKEETIELELITGRMRLVTRVLAAEERSSPIEEGRIAMPEVVTTAAAAAATGPSERWVPVSVIEHRLISGSTMRKRIGMVYQDALVVALALHSRRPDGLPARLERIQRAGYDEIWQVRAELRAEFAAAGPTRASEPVRR